MVFYTGDERLRGNTFVDRDSVDGKRYGFEDVVIVSGK